MGSPSVPYSMMADGFKITSGTNGFRAQASFLLEWQNAFTFHDEIMGYAGAVTVGPVTYNEPWRFPGSPARMYASSCEITPIGFDGQPLPPTLGMAPGEFWTHVRLDVTWETPPYPQNAADDPNNTNQLDPSNPIYNCEQSVRIGARTENRPKSAYQFASTTTEPADDVTVYRPEAKLVLHYPSVPFLAWKKYHPHVGKVNDATFLDCARGSLLFEGADIQNAPGARGTLGKSLTLEFAVHDVDDGWNKIPHPTTGTLTLVETKAGATKPHSYLDFRTLLL
jgi:hypothetical protein